MTPDHPDPDHPDPDHHDPVGHDPVDHDPVDPGSSGPDHHDPVDPRGSDALGMSTEEFRRLGYWIVDRVAERGETLADDPVIVAAAPHELRAQFDGPPPRLPGDPMAALELLARVAMHTKQQSDHPRYFARVPGPSSFTGVLGEWLGVGFNTIAASWGGGAGPTAVELVAIDWIRELMGLPEGSEGILVSGGSLANLTALVTARTCGGSGVAYLSDQTHSSVLRDLVIIGFPPEHIRIIDTREGLRLTAADVREAVGADRAAGLTPRIVIGTAGSTNTGRVDELDALADLCAEEGLWLHLDGAYGAPAALTDEGRAALHGMERADSLVLDPHKWLFQPFDVACVLVRRPGALEAAFSMNPEYLRDVQGVDDEVDLRNRGPELSRRARGLKLWLTFVTHGTERIGAAIQRGLDNATYAQSVLDDDPDWEVVTAAQLGVVTFVRRNRDDGWHVEAAREITESGYAALSCTRLSDRDVLRLCTINPRTTHDDIARTLQRLASTPERSPSIERSSPSPTN